MKASLIRFQLAGVAVLAVAFCACGSGGATGSGGNGGQSGNAGNGGATGTGGNGGATGSGGATGIGGRGGTGGGGSPGNGGTGGGGLGGHGGSGAAGTGGAGAGGSGAAGHGGSGGGGGAATGGKGGSGAAGQGGAAGGTGGSGGATACQAIAALDRSCSTDTDCVAVKHVANCCGTVRVTGLRASEEATFQQLESTCDGSYPACGCATGPTTTDDGSTIKAVTSAGVTCLQGTCTTFVAACGQPCAGGTTCFSCTNGPTLFAACTTICATSHTCADPTLPLCQTGTSGNVSGMYCTANSVACDTK